jgi:putative ABC transport system permease protein
MTLIAIVFGVSGLILSGGFVHDVYRQLGEALIHSQSGHLQVARAGFHAHGTRSPEKYLIDRPNALAQTLLKQPQVDEVMQRVAFSGLLNNGRTDWPIIGEGVEAQKESKLGTHVRIVHGRELRAGDRYHMLVGEGVARALQLRIGEPVTLLINTAEGALNTLEFDVVGAFQSFSKDYDARAVRIPLEAARELLRTDGANTLVVLLKRTADTAAVAEAVGRQLEPKDLEVATWEQLNDFYSSTVALYQRQFGVLQVIILILVLLSVANSINMSVFERVGEFGTMMALGNRTSELFRLILAESLLLGVIGSGIGATLGVALSLGISAIGIPMPPPPNANVGYTAHIQIVPAVVLMACSVGIFAAVLAAVWPAARVIRTPVADALRLNV